jgi:hypothetical protein
MTGKLVDMLGNEVHQGSLLYWAGTNLIVKVVGLTPETMTLAAMIPIANTNLKEFVLVVDPSQTAAVTDAMKFDASMAVGAKQ